MTACLKEDASACIGMATRLGPGRLVHEVTTTEQLADIMTKPYSFQTLSTLAPRIGLTKC